MVARLGIGLAGTPKTTSVTQSRVTCGVCSRCRVTGGMQHHNVNPKDPTIDWAKMDDSHDDCAPCTCGMVVDENYNVFYKPPDKPLEPVKVRTLAMPSKRPR